MEKAKRIQVGDNFFELNVEEKDSIIIARSLGKRTRNDLEIESLPIPKTPKWLNITVRLIRYYQRIISPRLGNRCVFDPSCSHYSELAFREKGLLRGVKLTIERLSRCRPTNGGIDLFHLK